MPDSDTNRHAVPGSSPRNFSQQVSLAFFLAVADIKLRYARSVLGPFWITIQLAFFVGMLGVVLSQVHGAPVQEFLPFFAVSMLMWTFMSACMVEGLDAVSAGGVLIRDRGVEPMVAVFQVIIRNLLIAAHSIIVPVAAFVIFGGASIVGLIMALPGLIIFFAIASLVTVCTAALGLRYRDFKRICESLVLLVFLSTPILWQPSAVRSEGRFVVDFNPFAQLFSVWREPLLTSSFSLAGFIWALITLGVAGVGAFFSARWLRNAAVWI
jgi:lipopolysaccharide transport system permease protein